MCSISEMISVFEYAHDIFVPEPSCTWFHFSFLLVGQASWELSSFNVPLQLQWKMHFFRDGTSREIRMWVWVHSRKRLLW